MIVVNELGCRAETQFTELNSPNSHSTQLNSNHSIDRSIDRKLRSENRSVDQNVASGFPLMKAFLEWEERMIIESSNGLASGRLIQFFCRRLPSFRTFRTAQSDHNFTQRCNSTWSAGYYLMILIIYHVGKVGPSF
jgi:hypothetical protein